MVRETNIDEILTNTGATKKKYSLIQGHPQRQSLASTAAALCELSTASRGLSANGP